jgi:hypothetical protein
MGGIYFDESIVECSDLLAIVDKQVRQHAIPVFDCRADGAERRIGSLREAQQLLTG